MDEVVANLKAVLLASKGGIALNRINKDYNDVVGEYIPYRKLNFKSLEEFLSVVPGLRKVLKGNECFIEAIPTSRTSHIASLVQGQKTDKRKRRVVANAYNRPRRPPSFMNQNSRSQFRQQPMNRTQSSTRTNMRSHSSVCYNIKNRRETLPTTQSDRDPRGFKLTVYEPEKPKISLQDRLVVTVQNQPKKTETVNIEPNFNGSRPTTTTTQLNGSRPSSLTTRLNGSRSSASTTPVNGVRLSTSISTSKETRNDNRTVYNLPIVKNAEPYEREDPNNYKPMEMTSMIPFEKFHEKKPEDELRFIAKNLGFSPPEFKFWKLPHQGYFATVQVGEVKYSSYPTNVKTEEEAKCLAISKALQVLKKKDEPTLSVTKDDTLVKERILKIISDHPLGVFTTQLSKYYKEVFKELLPSNVDEIINDCKMSKEIGVEEGVKGTIILTRWKAEERVMLAVSKMSISSQDNVPGALQIPDDDYWIAHVTAVFSTSEIMVQVVGSEYSDKLYEMTQEMNKFYSENLESTKVQNIEIGAYYVFQNKNDWFRVQCVQVDESQKTAIVDFIDYGDDEICPINQLYKLDKQFCRLPAQACCISLNELELFSLKEIDGCFDTKRSQQLIENYLLNRTFYVEAKGVNSERTPSVIFYVTKGEDEEINLNKLMAAEIKTCIYMPDLETQNISEVYVSHVSASGAVYVQIKNNCMFYLTEFMNKIKDEKLSQDYSQYVAKTLNLTKCYLAKDEGGAWYRIRISNVNYLENKVDALCVDFGYTITVNISDLVNLEELSDVLPIFPNQAVEVELHNVPLTSFDTVKIERLRKLTPPDQPVLMRVIQSSTSGPTSLSVELIMRQGPNNEFVPINSILQKDKKSSGDNNNNVKERRRSDRSMSRHGSFADQVNVRSRGLKEPEIPKVDELFNVHVTLVCSPGNFIVQPYDYKTKLEKMNDELFEACNNYKGDLLRMESIHEGSLYAARHSDGFWYRACVLNKLMAQMTVTIYLCDYGEVQLAPLQNLQPLSDNFLELPIQAIRAKVADVKPVNVDWAVEDCIWFKGLIEGKDFASRIRNIAKDCDETVLSLSLIDVSTEVDIEIDQLLLQDKRAQRTESYLKRNKTK